MSAIPLYWSPEFTGAIDPEARFPRLRYDLVRAAIGEAAWAVVRAAPLADEAPIRAVHDPAYVTAFLERRLDPAIERRIGLRPWRPEIRGRTLRIVGGTLAATQDVLHHGHPVAGNLAGGTHHAHADFGSGFCIFNDLVVAARMALAEGVRQVLVVDLDVHQGDGTATLCADEPRIFTYSLHCGPNFPFRKATSDLDVALPEGAGDEAYLEALEASLPALFDAVRPELVFYQAGVDPLAEDGLGRLALTQEGLRRRNDRVLELVAARGLPLVITMGGGYAEPLSASVAAHVDVYRQAAARLTSRSRP